MITSYPRGKRQSPTATGSLDDEQESVLAKSREALLEFAQTIAGGGETGNPQTQTTIAGAEWVMRQELAAGRSERIEGLMPEFAYLVALPYVERPESIGRMFESFQAGRR